MDVRRLRAILANIARMRELKGQISELRQELLDLGRFGSIVGASPEMRHVYELVARAAPTDVSVLLVGESGTGKDQVANALHELSKRHTRPFVAVNCGAIAPGLIESELFGHVCGAFTGAVKDRHGYFELAAVGTLFLDEITEMSMEFQVKLLRVLETQTVRPVGGEAPIPSTSAWLPRRTKTPRRRSSADFATRSVLSAERVSDPSAAAPAARGRRRTARRIIFWSN